MYCKLVTYYENVLAELGLVGVKLLLRICEREEVGSRGGKGEETRERGNILQMYTHTAESILVCTCTLLDKQIS